MILWLKEALGDLDAVGFGGSVTVLPPVAVSATSVAGSETRAFKR